MAEEGWKGGEGGVGGEEKLDGGGRPALVRRLCLFLVSVRTYVLCFEVLPEGCAFSVPKDELPGGREERRRVSGISSPVAKARTTCCFA